MARNQKYQDGRYLSLAATDPSTPASGDPVLVGQIPGVAQVDEGDGGVELPERDGRYSGLVAQERVGHRVID